MASLSSPRHSFIFAGMSIASLILPHETIRDISILSLLESWLLGCFLISSMILWIFLSLSSASQKAYSHFGLRNFADLSQLMISSSSCFASFLIFGKSGVCCPSWLSFFSLYLILDACGCIHGSRILGRPTTRLKI